MDGPRDPPSSTFEGQARDQAEDERRQQRPWQPVARRGPQGGIEWHRDRKGELADEDKGQQAKDEKTEEPAFQQRPQWREKIHDQLDLLKISKRGAKREG
jgi:hypothetical protein